MSEGWEKGRGIRTGGGQQRFGQHLREMVCVEITSTFSCWTKIAQPTRE
jgi:hypothetical protein